MTGAGKTRNPAALNDRMIERMKPEATPYRVPHIRCGALAIRVATDGSKTWDCAFRVTGGGPQRRPSLGRWPDIKTDQAFTRAIELTAAARQGVDLLAKDSNAFTIAELVERYAASDHVKSLRTALRVGRTLRRVLTPLATKEVTSVQRRDVARLLDAIEGRDAAEKARTTMRAMFGWAMQRGLVERNPIDGTATYSAGKPRERVLDADEIKTLWQWLPESGLAPSLVSVLKLQLSIGARSGEIVGMRAAEIDTATWTWTLPAARSKNNKERVTPLVGRARELVAERLAQTDELLFPAPAGGEMDSALFASHLYNRRDSFPTEHFTSHDLRRTVASQMARMGITLETIALVVGHDASEKSTKTLIKHYIHDDMLARKAAALEAWDKRLTEILEGEAEASNVVSLRNRS